MGFFKHLKNGLADDSPAREAEHEEGTEKDANLVAEPLEAGMDEEDDGRRPGVGNTPERG